MNVNRIFICHAIRNEDQQDILILHYLMDALQRAGRELIINNDNDSEYQQLYQELPTCQMFILFQTSNAFISPRVHRAVGMAQELARQKPLQIVRFICPSGGGGVPPETWRVLTTFDGTHNYQWACEQLVLSITDHSTSLSRKTGAGTTGIQPSLPYVRVGSTPIGPIPPQAGLNWSQSLPPKTIEVGTTGVMSPLSQVNVPEMPLQTNNNWSQPLPPTATEARTTGTQPSLPKVEAGLAPARTTPPQISSNWSQPMSPETIDTAITGPLPALRQVNVPKTLAQPNNDRPLRPPSIWNTRLQKFIYKADAKIGRRKLLIYTLVVLVILTIIGSAGTLFFQAQTNNATKTQDHGTPTVQPDATATAQAYLSLIYPSYLSGHGTPIFADSLSQEGEWRSESDSTGGVCQFTNSAYHVSQQPSTNFNHCDASGTFSNFAIEVQLTITKGDCGGMIFRNDGKGQYYYFHICRDGTYKVALFSNDPGTDLQPSTSSSAIHTGLNQPNTIAISASGRTMTFYANGQQIGQVQDDNYNSGSIGLIAKPVGRATDVAYKNARAWTL
jgi:hypothetical protein